MTDRCPNAPHGEYDPYCPACDGYSAPLRAAVRTLPDLDAPAMTAAQRKECEGVGERRPLIYMAAPVAPTAAQLASIDHAIANLEHSGSARAEYVRRIIDGNLLRARRWLRWFAINVPQWVVIAPWIAAVESVLEAGGEERTERAREMAVCREVASRCDAVVQVGGRVSSGMAEEGNAAPCVYDLTALGAEAPTTDGDTAHALVVIADAVEAARGR